MKPPLTPQSVGLIAGVSANYVQGEIRRGRLEAVIVQAGKCRRFLIDRQVAQEFAARIQATRRGKSHEDHDHGSGTAAADRPANAR